MNNRREDRKLAELRAKTDRQLVALIGNTLDRGLRFARVLPVEAERAYAEACRLLAAVPAGERARLDWRMARLRAALHNSSMAAC
jgi:hypothetical protein